MRSFKVLASSAVAAALLCAFSTAPAQVSINIGVPPVCPYGYFSYPPYDCAPYGYYGPDWFVGGVFIGAGPWYHWGHPAEFWNRGYYGRGWGGGYARGGWGYGHGYGRGGAYARGGYGHGFAGGGYHGGGG